MKATIVQHSRALVFKVNCEGGEITGVNPKA